ncbi:MAG: J domain-containing protein [Firmicutes bacterium]|nr:J domain-containing protein [Bacillota bacterium]
MNKDPYEVLGISRYATDDEVKKAYRELAKQYHPDRYVDNPLSDLAQEKFQEVQNAYETIMKERQNGSYGRTGYNSGYSNSSYSSSSYSNNGYSGYNGYNGYSGDNAYEDANSSEEMTLAGSYLQMGRYREALNLLARVSRRDAQWNYYCAVANQGVGNSMDALYYARQAVSMDPHNVQYRNFLNQLSQASNIYKNRSNNYTPQKSNVDPCRICMNIWCADTLCECMGADLCRCL